LHDRRSASTSSALQFWTRSDIDDNLKKRVDGMLLLDNDDAVYVDQVEEADIQQIESILSEVLIDELESDSSEVVVASSTEDNIVANITVLQEEDIMVSSTSELKQRVSSIPVGELASAFGERIVTLGLLPGKPLFMRPFKLRNEIISKVMEENPLEEYEDIEHGHIHEHIVMEEDKPDDQESKPTSSNYDEKQSKRRRFFRRNKRRSGDKINTGPSKEELNCPIIVKNIQELQSAVLANKIPLKDIGFRFPAKGLGSDVIFGLQQNQTSVTPTETIFIRDDPVINGPLSSLLTYDAKQSTDPNSIYYQQAIELLSHHPVLSIVRERVESKSKPGDRGEDDTSHLALVIEGGGMRGAVSAGMAAALSTLDLLDAFDSIHGSSAGAIVGAYLVSRQLCTDVYTDIMPAAGSTFASKRRGMVSFGWDWLESKLISTADEDDASIANDDSFCVVEDDIFSDAGDDNATSFWCENDVSSVERAMGEGSSDSSQLRRSYSDDHGVVFESMNFLLSKTARGVSKPLSYGVQRLGRAFDFANSMRQYMKKRPGMNLTYVLDGVMDETHGLRPFDLAAFRANDKKQPLYVVASAVSNGGKGEMETIAFNSCDGDFFGTAPDDEEEPTSKERVSWYRRVWSLFSFVPYSLFSAARRSLSRSAQEVKPLMKDTIEAEALPPGSSAMYGFSNRRKIRKLQRPTIDKKNYDPTGRLSDEGGGKDGIFTCLEASMLVPAAAGPPLQLIRSKNRHLVEQRSRFPMFRSKKEQQKKKEINSHLAYDAFCYEPIPYRSAVEKANATHVLALRSRPDGCIVESKQHMYEKLVAPIYFTKHGMNSVSKLFATGGSQYRYLEDVMILNEGLVQGIAMGQNISSDNDSRGVKVPPTQLYAGTDKANTFRGTEDWKQAHLLPITLPFDTPELPTLSQDKDEVMKAVRNGYAAAFDILAPIASLPFDSRTIPGDKVASILFPDGEDDIAVLDRPVKVKSSYIGEDVEEIKRRSFAAWVRGKREARNRAKDEIALHPDGLLARRQQRRNKQFSETDQFLRDDSNTLEYIETEALLAALPGFRGGRLDHIADNLLSISNEDRQEESLVK